jgi:hypothetical protein
VCVFVCGGGFLFFFGPYCRFLVTRGTGVRTSGILEIEGICMCLCVHIWSCSFLDPTVGPL